MLDHLVVDGYNVLHAWGKAGAMAVARQDLLRELELAAAQRGFHCTVVFDGGPIDDLLHASSQHLTVTFAGPTQTADSVIERLVCQQKAGLPPPSSICGSPGEPEPISTRRSGGASRPPRAGGRPEGPQRRAGGRRCGITVVTDDRVQGNLVVGWGAHLWSSTMLRQWLEGSA